MPYRSPGEGEPASSAALHPTESTLPLQPGRVLRGLVVHQVLAEGTTSTVYRADEVATKRPVVLKEYLPRHLVQRLADGSLRPLQAQAGLQFARGLHAFRDEARLLMGSNHPGLVQVHQQWEQGGTAYLVMPWTPGTTLQDWLAGLGTPPGEAWLRELLQPIMQALEALHRQGLHHGDLSLQSIWLQFDSLAQSYLSQKPRPLLLGTSAARRAVMSLPNTPVPWGDAEDAFGPVEQYDGEIRARRGAWTDVYGLCAVTYAALFGRPPPPSMMRMAKDDLVSARKLGRGRYSPALLAAIDAGLVVRPQHRVQSMAALRQLLEDRSGMLPTKPAVDAAQGLPAMVTAPGALLDNPPPAGEPSAHGQRWLWSAGLGVLLMLLALLGVLVRS